MIRQSIHNELLKRLTEKRRFVQVGKPLSGNSNLNANYW